jgi:pantetheine-phosphate adenylyltransferase
MAENKKTVKIGVYPGTFDPPTNGHVDIALRASLLFDKIVIGVSNNAAKNPLFGIDERVEMLQKIFANNPKIEVKAFAGLLADFVKEENAAAIVRGLRAVSDFEYELQMALFNSHLNTEIETVFLMAKEENLFVSSSIIKDISRFGGDVSMKIPDVVWNALKAKFNIR